MVNKDVTHPRMRRLIKNPRIVLLDCSLEYKKGESQVKRILQEMFPAFDLSLVKGREANGSLKTEVAKGSRVVLPCGDLLQVEADSAGGSEPWGKG